MLSAYENPSRAAVKNIEYDLNTIKAVNQKDYEVAKTIAEHWEKVYLDPDYELLLYRDGESEFEITGICNTGSHAFVVLGYELQDGEMTEELKGRCNAAAAAARAYPEAVLICSGGATGANNPERHTEAGMMRDYLVKECGIDASRIITDEKAMTTAENAINTFEILRAQGIRTITIVTSSYHQRWGQVLYNALAAIYNQKYGFEPVIIGNCCFETEPTNGVYRNDAGIAVNQLRSILGLQRQT